MAIDFRLLTYDKITDLHALAEAGNIGKPPSDEQETFNAVDIIRSTHFTEIRPKYHRFNFQSIGKFHLSLNEEDIGRAWDAIVPLLAGAGMVAKVITPAGLKKAAEELPDARGKHIVIYFDGQQAQEKDTYAELLTAIERTLREQRIRPGVTIAGERSVPGSQYAYMSYGNAQYDRATGLAEKGPHLHTPMDEVAILPDSWARRIPGSSTPREIQ